MKKFIVITTIHEISKGIQLFAKKDDWQIILVGDKKSASINNTTNIKFLSVDDQLELGYNLLRVCPYNHYTRKNIGYLYAIENGADVIYDTDDDNIPYDSWNLPESHCNHLYKSNSRFINIFKHFSNELIWPRGFPLNEIDNNSYQSNKISNEKKSIGIWQGLADLDPDVDAIYRLTINKKVKFNDNHSITLDKNTYCPFNSQNTFWFKECFPYLYLPATTSFRFTDILRGYIAQRLIWEHDLFLGFNQPTVYQERNVHNLMEDFSEEIECYLGVMKIVDQLNSLSLHEDPIDNLITAYKKLIENNLIKQNEFEVLDAWTTDFNNLR